MGEQNRRMVDGGADPAASRDPAAAPGLTDAPHAPARPPHAEADPAPPPADADEQAQVEDQVDDVRDPLESRLQPR